jgi:type I restriction enzyme S subunit
MVVEWQHKRIEEVAEKVAMGPFGSSIKVSTFVPDGIPVISGQHLHEARLQDTEYNFITPEHAQKLSNANVFRGDVIFTHAGNIGQVAFIPDDSRYERYIISQRQFYMRCEQQKIIPAFVTYYFKTPEGRHRLLANSSSSGVPSIVQPVTYLRSVMIPVPPLKEQQAIACILGTLDDKIELNRRLNRTLEYTARAIFKSWFVDFNPVRAKAAIRREHPDWSNEQVSRAACPNLKLEITALFPDTFEDSELGKIPRGWEVFSLPEAITVNPKRPLRKGAVAPYLDMANMPTQGHMPDVVIDRPFGSGMRFVNGDTLVARITPCLENGKTAYIDFLEDGQVGWGSTEYIVLRPKPPLPEEFAYCLARCDGFREFAIQSMTGSSGRQRVPAESLSHYQLVAPPEQLAKCFGSVVRSLFARASAATHESCSVATLRDSLLPKLMSGELLVPDAERIVGRSV